MKIPERKALGQAEAMGLQVCEGRLRTEGPWPSGVGRPEKESGEESPQAGVVGCCSGHAVRPTLSEAGIERACPSLPINLNLRVGERL